VERKTRPLTEIAPPLASPLGGGECSRRKESNVLLKNCSQGGQGTPTAGGGGSTGGARTYPKMRRGGLENIWEKKRISGFARPEPGKWSERKTSRVTEKCVGLRKIFHHGANNIIEKDSRGKKRWLKGIAEGPSCLLMFGNPSEEQVANQGENRRPRRIESRIDSPQQKN